VTLTTTCIKNVKFKIIKIRTGYQYVGYFYYSEILNWVACGPRIERSWSSLSTNGVAWEHLFFKWGHWTKKFEKPWHTGL